LVAAALAAGIAAGLELTDFAEFDFAADKFETVEATVADLIADDLGAGGCAAPAWTMFDAAGAMVDAAGIFILWPHWPHLALLPASSSLTL
jgi:hypothetical protein